MKNSKNYIIFCLVVIVLILSGVLIYSSEGSTNVLVNENIDYSSTTNKFSTESAVVKDENSTEEKFEKVPAAIKSIKYLGNNQWSLEVDILSHNPDWVPGGYGGLYENQSIKIRNLIINKNTKNFTCEFGMFKGEFRSSTDLMNQFNETLDTYRVESQNNPTGYKADLVYDVDIEGGLITATYESCSS